MPTSTGAPLNLSKFAHSEKAWGDLLDTNFDVINTAINALNAGVPTSVTISIAVCADVLETALANGDALIWNASASKWKNVASSSFSGATGAAGQGFNFLGGWLIGTTYAAYDVVTYANTMWIAIGATTGDQPDTDGGIHWAALVGPGPTGAAGAPGGVTSVNTRTGVITLGEADITGLVGDLATLTTAVAAAATVAYVDSSIAAEPGENDQTGTAYTLIITDKDIIVTMNNAGANAVTIPPNSSVAFPLRTTITVIQLGAGQTSFVAGGGVTLHNPSTLNARVQYSIISALKIATDTWIIAGDLA